jgi:hypothetical protein
MGFKMNGSPAKLGTIQGTSGHISALKQTTKHGTDTYTAAWKNMKETEKAKYGEDKDGGFKKFKSASETWWKSEEGQKFAKKDPKFKHRIIKTQTNVVKDVDDDKNTTKNITKNITTKNITKDTYGTKSEAMQDLDVRMAKRGRKSSKKIAKKNVKIARDTYGRGSEEVETAKKVKKATKRKGKLAVLQAKKEDFRDDRGIFSGIKRSINRGRINRLKKKIIRKGDEGTLKKED